MVRVTFFAPTLGRKGPLKFGHQPHYYSVHQLEFFGNVQLMNSETKQAPRRAESLRWRFSSKRMPKPNPQSYKSSTQPQHRTTTEALSMEVRTSCKSRSWRGSSINLIFVQPQSLHADDLRISSLLIILYCVHGFFWLCSISI